MNILFVSSEVAPYSQTGGLGDVSQALPAALAGLGHTVWVVSPWYRGVHAPVHLLERRLTLRFPFGKQDVGLALGQLAPRHHLLLLEHEGFYGREGVYGDRWGPFPDNHRRFALLCIGALAAAEQLGWKPHVVHANDWPTGLVAPAMQSGFAHSVLADAACVFTIHNLAYQGLFPKLVMPDLGLPWNLFTPDRLEFYDQVSFMKAGIFAADAITTVSPTYAKEIQTSAYGENLDAFLQTHTAKLSGILNGVDYTEWNPETDSHLPVHYSAANLAPKAECKRVLRDAFSLRPASEGFDPPVFAMVTRLAQQKGVDLVLDALPALLAEGIQLVVVGSGDENLEERLRVAALHHPGQVGVFIGFQPKLAHWAEGGADFFLMPSRYEPCGLNQMYSLRYGTPPIVRATGGLEDTVVDLSESRGDGFKFRDFAPAALMGAVRRAIRLYQEPKSLESVRQRGMGQEFSWIRSAQEYAKLYRRLGSVKHSPAEGRALGTNPL